MSKIQIAMPPMITVKKPDGTTEKITLAEFKARQQKPPRPAANAPAVKPTVKPAMAQPSKSALSPAPSKPDAGSLLEEEAPTKSTDMPLLSSDKNNEADAIIKKLNISLPPHVVGRLRRQIGLRLKDVRSEDETKEWLMTPEAELGVGLNEAQAQSVLKACREYSEKSAKAPIGLVEPLKKSIPPAKAIMKEEEMLPQKYSEPNPPATSSPFTAFKRPPSMSKETKSFDDLMKTKAAATAPEPEKPVQSRPIIRDIAPSKQVSLGPIDEVRMMTLTDFRRLSSVPAEAAARLKQKFINLRDESYVLFLDALDAWKVSPLRLDYIGRVNEAINSGKPLDQVLADKNQIQLNEIRALIEMEKELG